ASRVTPQCRESLIRRSPYRDGRHKHHFLAERTSSVTAADLSATSPGSSGLWSSDWAGYDAEEIDLKRGHRRQGKQACAAACLGAPPAADRTSPRWSAGGGKVPHTHLAALPASRWRRWRPPVVSSKPARLDCADPLHPDAMGSESVENSGYSPARG